VTAITGRPGRARTGALATAAVIASSAALAACSSSSAPTSSSSGSAAARVPVVSLATSLGTAKESWAIVPMTANPTFWEVFVRPAKSATWQLVTPPGVADNGGLVAAADSGKSLTVAVRPSQDLEFTPVASTADGGANWSAGGPLSAGVAASTGALAVSGSRLAALLGNGTIEASSDAGGSWRTLAKPGAIAASAAGKKCGTVGVTAVSFGPLATDVLAAGTCGATGTTSFFDYSTGSADSTSSADVGWQRLSLPVSGQLVRLGADDTALVRAKAGLTAVWLGSYATGWYAYAPLASAQPSSAAWTASAPLPVTSAVVASGGLAGATAAAPGGMWVLLPGGQAATIAGPGQQWLLLPPTPAHTSVLASGPGNSLDALAVSGATLTVWQLDRGSTVWAKAQTLSVPIQYGSSS
jgi:hypothetical protein